MYSPLLTDQYQLVMAYGYWQLGMGEREAVFHLSFRALPLQSNYMVIAGLQAAIDFLQQFHFTDADIDYLKTLTDHGQPLFSPAFLQYLKNLTFTCDLDAIAEGNVIFAKEPVLRIKGPIIQCQLLETALLNFVNFATLIATKAARIYQAALGNDIIEFGLRRAQGPDGGLTASRNAYIGGCHATSNTLAGKIYGIPIQGTQSHSWIMAFPSEREAFQSFAQVMGSKTVLLVDTYHTINGIKHAIEIGHLLRKKGQTLLGIRLDSGDLLVLSQEARQLLDAAGLQNTKILVSGDLDEEIIHHLKTNNAPIDAFGVGTRLVTGYHQPALNTIYKLTAIRNTQDKWDYKMKISDDLSKSTIPGIQQVRRYPFIEDVIYDIESKEPLKAGGIDLLQPIFRQGKLVYSAPHIHEIRAHCIEQVHQFSTQGHLPLPVRLSHGLNTIITNYLKKCSR